MTEEKTPEYEPIRWSEDNLVMFFDGYAYTAVRLDGHVEHVRLGKEDDVKAMLSGTKPITEAETDRQVRALARILEIREESDGADIGSGSLERRRSIRSVRDRSKNARLSQGRKRIPRGKAYRQIKSISGR